MTDKRHEGRAGANTVVEVDEKMARPPSPLPATPFNGLLLIQGIVGYLALSLVILVGIGLLVSGVGLWPLVVAALIVIVAVRWLRRL